MNTATLALIALAMSQDDRDAEAALKAAVEARKPVPAVVVPVAPPVAPVPQTINYGTPIYSSGGCPGGNCQPSVTYRRR